MLLSDCRPNAEIIALDGSGFAVPRLKLQVEETWRIIDPKAEQGTGLLAKRAVKFRHPDSVITEHDRGTLTTRQVATFIVHGTPHLVRSDAFILLLAERNSRFFVNSVKTGLLLRVVS